MSHLQYCDKFYDFQKAMSLRSRDLRRRISDTDSIPKDRAEHIVSTSLIDMNTVRSSLNFTIIFLLRFLHRRKV